MKRIPAWLKILGGLLVLSIAVSFIAAVSVSLIPTAFFLVLFFFPGQDKGNPWLFRIVPYLWILGLVVAIVFLGADFAGKELLDADSHKPTTLELWSTVLFTPPLLWSFWKRNRYFKPLLLLSTALFVGNDGWDFFSGIRDIKAMLDFAGNFSAEVLLTVYLLLKFKPVQQ